MFFAKSAKLIHLQPVRRVLFVFRCVVVALLAFRTSKRNSDFHNGTSISFGIISLPLVGKQGTKKEPSLRGRSIVTPKASGVKQKTKKRPKLAVF